MNTPRPWGVFFGPEVRHAAGFCCLDCYFNFIGWDFNKYIVGFTTDNPPSYRNADDDGGILGAFILECPKCFTYYWLHASGYSVEDAIETCPNWPKNKKDNPL